MSQQPLDGQQIHAPLEQAGRVAVAQHMGRDPLVEARLSRRLANGELEGGVAVTGG